MEAKMALIEIVRNFKIELSPETEVPIFVYMDCVYGSVQIRTYIHVNLAFERYT